MHITCNLCPYTSHMSAAMSVELLPGSFLKNGNKWKNEVELVTYAFKYCKNVKQLYHSLCWVPTVETSFNLWLVMLQLCITALSFNLPSSQNTPFEVQAPRYNNKTRPRIDSALFPCVVLWFSAVSVKL